MLARAIKASIVGVAHFSPKGTLSNESISEMFPEWSIEKITQKTGILSRPISADSEFSSDLASGAVRELFRKLGIGVEHVDYIILCTQTPDFLMPGTACLVHREMNFPKSTGAIDVNQGCSGYVYSLGLAKGLIETRQATNVLVVTADTYSKLINKSDKSVRTIFGDSASATLISAIESDTEILSDFCYGTDGKGAHHLMTTAGNLRPSETLSTLGKAEERNLEPSRFDLFMNGPEIFNFTLQAVPNLVARILQSSNLSMSDIDLVVPHQANGFMLEHLRGKLAVPEEKFVVDLEDCGNTVSSSIPIALAKLDQKNQLRPGMTLMLLGFGVGLSWGGCLVRWS